jgi:hypothetical protein
MGKSKNGYILLLIPIFLVIVIVTVIVFFAYKNGNIQLPSNKSANPSKVPLNSPTPTVSQMDISNWKTYSNTKFGYSFQYPSHWKVNESKNKFDLYEQVIAINLPPNAGNKGTLGEIESWKKDAVVGNKIRNLQYELDEAKESGEKIERISLNENTIYKYEIVTPGKTITKFLFFENNNYLTTVSLTVFLNENDTDNNNKEANQILSTFRFTDEGENNLEVIDLFIDQWGELQKDSPFDPILGATNWYVDNFQFIGSDTFLIVFEDGHTMHSAVYRKDNKSFVLLKSIDQTPLSPKEWNSIIETYGNNSYEIITYKNTINGWVTTVDNPFVFK